MQSYDDIAHLLEKASVDHQRIADLLIARNDPKHNESNATLADAKALHADACKRAAQALRDRSNPTKNAL